MNNSEKDDSEACMLNLAVSRTNNHTGIDFSVSKSGGSFDAEFDLLESTLSELKDGEHDSASSIINANNFNIEANSKINKLPSNNNADSHPTPASEALKVESKVMYLSLDQDTCNRPDCALKYHLSTTQHSKSMNHQENAVFNSHNSENVSSNLDNNSSGIKFEMQNSSSMETVNKPVLIDEFIQTKNNSDKIECVRPYSPLLRNVEDIDRVPNHSDSTSTTFKGDEFSKVFKNSVECCDFVTVTDKSPVNLANKPDESNLKSNTIPHDSSLNRVNTCEYPSEVCANMDDAVISNDKCTDIVLESNSSCHPGGSNNDLAIVKKSEPDGSKLFDSDLHRSVGICVQDSNGSEGNKIESDKDGHLKSIVCESTMSELNCDEVLGMNIESEVYNNDAVNELGKKQGIFCSTPNVTRKLKEDLNHSTDASAADFGLVSPLEDMKCLKGKQILKRKYIGLQTIEETNEETDGVAEKKIKVPLETDKISNSSYSIEAGTSSTAPCFEAPAKSLLKKWQPSCLSRNVSSSSFIVLDECGDTELEDCAKLSQDHDSSRIDDFEIACQSLTEELMKSSSNIETLEKYHSQVQLENQMDDEKFDEIWKEITMNVDLGDETCLSVKTMDESTIVEAENQCDIQKGTGESVYSLLLGTEGKGSLDNADSQSENNTTIKEEYNHSVTLENDDPSTGKRVNSNQFENAAEENSMDDNTAVGIISNKDKTNIIDEEDVDEEEFLLEENVGAKDKPYEFFEFVSTDPKENEDNYNPEWQKLGQLTTDEERYKAVRDRWRSLVPPDPNRNLTYRQWRTRNQKPPIKLSPLNNNHQLLDDNQKNQLCTAVFDNKIKKIVQELEDSRMNIYRQRNREFEELGHVQDDEQMRAAMSGFNYRQMAQLHSNHLHQCRAVKIQYDQELKRIQDITEEKIRILREAKEEVLLFQKFYKGVGARDDNEMYLTDIQVQELMETEEMLEKYKVFYK